MRDQVKKTEDDLLIVHKPAATGKTGHPQPPEAQILSADLEQLAARLAASTADERTRLLGAVQSRFGNAFATRVVETARRGQAAPAAEKPSSGHQR